MQDVITTSIWAKNIISKYVGKPSNYGSILD